MPFAEQFLTGYTNVIQPALHRAGLECVRADAEVQGHIHHQMFERILESQVVVADLTGLNPNVLYELGVAHSFGRKTVVVVREDYLSRIPFDIAPYRVLPYPSPTDGDSPQNSEEIAATVEKLAAEVSSLIEVKAAGISNPVQDYLAGRSPLSTRQSRHLPRLGADLEEEMVRRLKQEFVYVSITGHHLVTLLANYLESGERTEPLKLKMLLLSPDDHEAWEFVYRLRDGQAPSVEDREIYMGEDRALQKKSLWLLKRLMSRIPTFSCEVWYYSSLPLSWTCWIDRERFIVGHLAADRTSSRNLPVHVIVKDDSQTTALYEYYESQMLRLIGNGRREL
ncbi:nucleoside 2-deoxyribosyltransferase [Fimbriiglobus ruber]|nr:nucleoside 2-deoxyribosyltransferase [Fimbriiglobus ruber]